MIPIPGWLIAILTFPGVIVHEAAHMLFCRLCQVPILDVQFFKLPKSLQLFSKEPVGYVLHLEPKSFTATFFISIGPFLINSLLCIIICFPVIFPIQYFGEQNLLFYPMIWLGISIGMHAFPSTQDAKLIWDKAKKEVKKLHPLAIISFPVVILIYLANILSFIWFDYLYGFFLGFILPRFLIENILLKL